MPDMPMNPITPQMPAQPMQIQQMEQPEEPIQVDVDSDHIQDADIRLEQEQKEQKSAQYVLSIGQKAEIVAYIKKLVDDCTTGRSEWKANLDECIDLYEGIRPPKSDPWPNCSNVTTRVTAMHSKLMHAKLYPAIWNDNLIHWRPREKNDLEAAETVGKFMSWVVQQELRLGDKIDDILHDLIVYGTVAIKIRWDTEYRNVRDKETGGYKKIARQKACVENIPIDNVYIPNTWTTEDQSPYIAHNAYMTLPDIKDLKNRGHFVCNDEDLKKIQTHIDTNIPTGIVKKQQEILGLAEYLSHVNTTPLRLIECYIPWDINGELVESVFVINYDGDVYLSGKPLTAISPTGTRPIVIGQFIRKSNLPYGSGLPELMKGLAHELDAIHNQRIDAGTVTISPFGVYRAASSFSPNKVKLGPGTMVPVDDINDVKFVQFPAGGLATSFQEERIIIEYIEKLTATSAYQMGRESEVAKSRATATGTMAIISQGEQAYTLMGIRTQRIVARLLGRILEMYQCFMPTGLVDRVLGADEAPMFPNGLTKEDIIGNYDAYMTLDQTSGNKQMERQVNASLIQMAPNLLSISQDPRGYRMAEDFLKSMGKVDVERYLGKKPPDRVGTAGGLGNFAGGGLPVGPQGSGQPQEMAPM